MPNHVTNRISKTVADLLRNEDGEVDFNSIIPMPESLSSPDPQQLESRAKAALGLYVMPSGEQSGLAELTDRMEIMNTAKLMFKPLEKDQIDLLIQAITNIRDHGFAYWHPWACHHWGTKWGVYNVEEKGDFVTFDTAWSHPQPVFLKLSELNPDLTIKVEYADEDTGSNCGTIIYRAGSVVSEEIAPRWDQLDEAGKRFWQRFALSITDPDNIEDRLAEYEEDE